MRKHIDVTENPTSAPIERLAKASSVPISADADYSEFSEAELSQFARISIEKKVERQKQTATLHLSPQALKKAKSLGKGYASVRSRILEGSLDNPDIVKRNL